MLEIIKLSTKSIQLKRNQFLKVEGSIDTNLYHIDSGSIRIFISIGDQEQNIRFGYKNDLVVALDSFITLQPSALFIQAIKKASIKIITRSQLNTFLKAPEHLPLWNRTLENLAIQQFEREIDLLHTSPKDRYERLLKRSPKVFQEVPNKHIANYLRMSPETLSRLHKS